MARTGFLPDLLLAQVESQPEATAVACGDEYVTYRELAVRSAELGARLRQLGIGPDDCVGLFADPSIDLMVGAWGILFSGGAYLPLSPEYPEERLRYMLEDSRAAVVFTQEDLRPRFATLAPADTRIITLEDLGQGGATETPARADSRPDSLAYIIYTSGSTGKPKGVMIEHESVVNQMNWLGSAHDLGPDQVVLQKTPMSFDAAQWEILAPALGSLAVMGEPGIYRDPEKIIATVRKYGVTTLQCVPTLLQALLDTEELHTCESLTQIFSGGEALSLKLATDFLDSMPRCDLINLYGPTECTINSSSFPVDRNGLGAGSQTISIGTPALNTQYHILDDARNPVSIGEIGELHIGGVQLARGYLHRPDLTEQRFLDHGGRLFRTGDLAYWNTDGTVQFVGRADNQVKLRGFRVELDEIRLAIETHDWVKNAAVLVKNDPQTGFQNLIACIELNPKEAALMDQGNHGAHHQSKASRLQVRSQLSNPGVRDTADLEGRPSVKLPGHAPALKQRQQAFSRKTYRFYEGEDLRKSDLLELLGSRPVGTIGREPSSLDLAELGEILRYFGRHVSDERLLPKYGYASPGALYATQMYLELSGNGIEAGTYYYHPLEHRLVLMKQATGQSAQAGTRIHFVGRKGAIQPVYENNIAEVLEIEAGHMVGLFEAVLPGYGLDLTPSKHTPAVKTALGCAAEDYYLGTFDLVTYTGPKPDEYDLYVQAHPGRIADLPAGQYRYTGGQLVPFSDELVLRKQVIAINQAVYERASIGITVISRTDQDRLRYIDLGRAMQRLSMNELNLGFMSSGYSSKTGHDLPSARRFDTILRENGERPGASYFFVGGRVSDEQRRGEGMREDVVHMRGPAELIKDDLVKFLPDYMIPNKVAVLDALPVTANGKIDVRALQASSVTDVDRGDRPFIAPRTATERRVSELWKKLMKRETVSTRDDFFESGGNSLIAVALINRINRDLGVSLPLQALFDSPTVEKLAARLDSDGVGSVSRLVLLAGADSPAGSDSGQPVFCWPGLGGYTMNLRSLAKASGIGRAFYGVQAHGINEGETPYGTIAEMAAADIEAIKRVHPEGPYTLWGYSFGARVAFETAHQLEQAGDRVENLFLIAPGSPKVRTVGPADEATYDNPAFVTILFSVFAGSITDPRLRLCLEAATDEESFAEFIGRKFGELDRDLVRRVIRIVAETFEFKYVFSELAQRHLTSPITIFKATGDDYSFLEGSAAFSTNEPEVIELEADHYSLLREPDIAELLTAIHRTENRAATESIGTV